MATAFAFFRNCERHDSKQDRACVKKGMVKFNMGASNIIKRDNNLLLSTIGDTRYLAWWKISDLDYRLTGMCETMSRIVCHTSLLKKDDYRLKGLPMNNRTCT